ncbi:hypothetical protein HUE87_05930 [Candidatus Sulfurimonas marisnigri]|uniref:Uncharacterized protein n=1 Tax=Candidatus Sulfurimonas marisnigri TaxID=2740405 RepID=A0A7S7M2A6_9BACT|nr:hypothetical protein [Candidatus Sulfurimonas marisnigri]QOY55762.1 hypothetical protein HUE87_05930 [Candidatus Sulfurimonas marisnigri]
MNGTIMVTYKILCNGDLNKEISLKELLLNEKVAKAIKSEFAKGFRNIALLSTGTDASLKIKTTKELHSFEVTKDDFADILVLAEEDAATKKLLKKDCERVELVDIETL